MRSARKVTLANCSTLKQQNKRRGVRTVIVVVANNQLFNKSILAQLTPDVLVKCIKVHLHLLRVHLVLGVVRRVLVEVGQQDSLRVRRLDVFPGAAVAVTAGANLVVEGAIDLVLLGTEDGGEVVGHDCGCSRECWRCWRCRWKSASIVSRENGDGVVRLSRAGWKSRDARSSLLGRLSRRLVHVVS